MDKRDDQHKRRLSAREWVVTILAACSAAVGGLVGAVSLTRIASDYLGFPTHVLVGGSVWDLAWTLTGAVDVGATAGAVLWVTSLFGSRNRARGRWLNICCSTVSALGVGLDHATNASPVAGLTWPVIAFGIGAFLPALSTWLIHVLAHLVTEQAEQAPTVRTAVVVEGGVPRPIADPSDLDEALDDGDVPSVLAAEASLVTEELGQLRVLPRPYVPAQETTDELALEAIRLGVPLDDPTPDETDSDRRRREERNRKRVRRAQARAAGA